MEKIDFKKTLKDLYFPSKRDFTIVSVPKMNFLTIVGKGNPNTSSDFQESVEGLSVQILHIGSYDTEKETITKMKEFIKENKFIENGPHHEIYLSDPRKTSPDKLKTILRQPVNKI